MTLCRVGPSGGDHRTTKFQLVRISQNVFACFALVWAMHPMLAGCTTAIHAVNNPLEIAPSEYDRLLEAAVDELRDRGFVVDRHDYRFGTVSTRPVGSPTILEPWRADNSIYDQAVASTVNYQRRQITITLEPVKVWMNAGMTVSELANR